MRRLTCVSRPHVGMVEVVLGKNVDSHVFVLQVNIKYNGLDFIIVYYEILT